MLDWLDPFKVYADDPPPAGILDQLKWVDRQCEFGAGLRGHKLRAVLKQAIVALEAAAH